MKTYTYATDEEVSNALSEIIPENHSVMGYSRDEQIAVALDVVRRTGKSIRINAMQIHPSTPVSFVEKVFRGIVTLVVLTVIAIILMGIVVALASMVAS